MTTFKLIGLLLLAWLLAGCETAPRERVLDAVDETIDAAIAGNTAPAVPADVADALLPALELDPLQSPIIEDDQRFDISVQDVSAPQFFLSLVEGTGYNMVVHPEVQGALSLNLRNVTIPEVLGAVRDVYGFEFVRTSYGFQVLPGRLQARIYQIDFLNVLRSGTSSSFVSSGTLTSRRNSTRRRSDDGKVELGGSQSRTAAGTQIETELPTTAFWEELQFSISALVGDGEGRSVVVNPQSGVVVVRALPTELREVETFLKATQLIVQRQVILEAKIIEVELNERYQTGINWGALIEVGSADIGLGQTGGGTVLVNEGNASDLVGASGNLNPSNFSAIEGALASAFGGVFTLALSSSNFNTFVELLQLQGNVQVLSSPRIATLNNQKAVIKVGQDEFFVTDVSTITSVGTTTTTNPNVELTPFFSGIALDVTPQISEGGTVTLHIHPTVSQVVDQRKQISFGSITQSVPLALSTVRETDSIVRAKNGQVIVVGGLMLDRLQDNHAKPPGLGDIPGVGALFRQQLKTSSKSELVILLRPIVVEDDDQWVEALTLSDGNYDDLRQELRTRAQPPAQPFNP